MRLQTPETGAEATTMEMTTVRWPALLVGAHPILVAGAWGAVPCFRVPGVHSHGRMEKGVNGPARARTLFREEKPEERRGVLCLHLSLSEQTTQLAPLPSEILRGQPRSRPRADLVWSGLVWPSSRRY